MNCITANQVVAWADSRIATFSDTSQLPTWLLELSQLGPQQMLEKGHPDYPKAKSLSFEEQFRAKIETTNANDTTSVKAFMNWVVKSALGEDLNNEDVHDAYMIDHLLDDCRDEKRALASTVILIMKRKNQCKEIENTLGHPTCASSGTPEVGRP